MEATSQNDEFSLILASSVHDMKNSLSMLLSSLEEVIHDAQARDEHQAKQFATLQYEASRINGELVQLLSVYRMQKDRLPVAIDEYYVAEFLEDQLARNETLFATRNIECCVECDPDLVWYFDNDMIASVINDALVNSSRYSKDKVMLSACVVDDSLHLHVSDNGPGYPKAMLGEQSVEYKPTVYDRERTNLGLYFATRVAALHTRGDSVGRLFLANEGRLGGGEFILWLP